MQAKIQKRGGCSDGLRKTLLGCDRLPESFQLKVDGNGSSSAPTYAGAFLSLILLLTLAFYSAYKVNMMSQMGS